MIRLARICFIASVFFAVWTIIVIVQMGGDAPAPGAPMSDGFQTPMIALEFAGSEADLAFLEGENGAELRAELQRVQTLDFWFPIAYAGLAFWFFAGAFFRGQKFAAFGGIIALATIFADWNENAVINAMLASMDEGVAAASYLPDLAAATWIKWLLIAAYALVFSVTLYLTKRPILGLPGLLAGGLIIAAAIMGGDPVVTERLTIPLALFFLTILLTAMIYLRTSFKTEMGSHESPRKVET
ncbi:MAG: hypothetical protein DHS20C06_10280 [Hyphobacterium sp.]|nr:MAG: hypothetical protein DHS20C06_10280 [Hyphobacterium sp.]